MRSSKRYHRNRAVSVTDLRSFDAGCCMWIKQKTCAFMDVLYCCNGRGIVDCVARKLLARSRPLFLRHMLRFLAKARHEFRHTLRITLEQIKQKTFEVT